MINSNAKRLKEGWDVATVINGTGDCVFHEIRSIIGEFLSDEKLSDMFTHALELELKKVEKDD